MEFLFGGHSELRLKLDKMEEAEEKYLTRKELILIYTYLMNQYIHYENIPLLELVKRIRNIVDEE